MIGQEIPNLAAPDVEIAQWIWTNLVPRTGQASSLQGELLRAVEKLRWEAQTNGNINWSDGFEMLIDLLAGHLLGEPRFSRADKAVVESDLDRLRNFLPVNELVDDADAVHLPYVNDDLYDRLSSFVVQFCRLNPWVIPYQPDPRQYL